MRPSNLHLQCATQALIAGGVIAYPTESVWASAVTLETKQRSLDY